ncbi:MAG: ABC-2 family transporter protein [Peptococcaceae bacterium]|jgi:ABC-2 type transport system permease protein|nr:ABC-2 family transporter protein [Peptococcaceae bacterium]
MRKHLKIFACYFRLNLSSALEYRASFFSQAFGMALSNSSFLFFWWIAFQQIGGAIAGYRFEDVLFIWAVASSGYGFAHILFANAAGLTRIIVTGELDVFLLQPCNVLLNVLCAKTILSAYGDLCYGFALMLLFYRSDIMAWIWFFYGALIAGALITAISLTAHSLSFYFGDMASIGQMAMEFTINFSIYPDRIYAPAVRAVMYSIIPAGIAVHVPLRLFREFSPLTALVALGGALLYCACAALVFYRGLDRYESGNVIVTRL